MPIRIASFQSSLRVPRKRMTALLEKLLDAEGYDGSTVEIAVVDDDEIQRVHREFMDIDTPTDVISFPLDTDLPRGAGPPILGELVISADTAVREAAKRDHGPQVELLLYAVHGTLHLLGYDDRTEADAEVMRRREREVLGRDLFAGRAE